MVATPAAPAPKAPQHPHVHQAHGVSRDDPWAWLRGKTGQESLTYLDAERAYYDEAVADLAPLRDRLLAEMTARLAPDEESVRWREGEYLYFTAAVPGQEYRQLRRTPLGDPSGAGVVLLDENALASGHDFVELGVRLVSPDGRLLAYSVDHDGDEVYELRFRDLSTGLDQPDTVGHTYYTGAWSADASFFFYTVNDEVYRPYQVWRHELGSLSSGDVLVYEEPDDQFELTVESTRSGEWVVVTAQSRNTSEVLLIPAAEPTAAPRVVEPRRRGTEYSVAHVPGRGDDDGLGGDLLITTNDDAVEFRLMRAPVSSPGRGSWREIVAERADERLHGVDVFAYHAVLHLVRDAQQVLRIVPLELLADPLGSGVGIDVTSGVTAGLIELGPNEEPDVETILVEVESAVQPRAWYSVSLETGERTLVKAVDVPIYDPARYLTDRVEVTSRDGVSIPVTIVRRHDVELDGSAPCLLYGYGAYESSWWPGFEPALASLLDAGMVYVHAHVRGGGERGRRWWLDGRLETKVHTFDDFIDVADALDADGIVDGSRIVSRGLSAGGLLQGAVFSMRPDRWRAVVAEVPFVDVVTSMSDAGLPLTAGEWDEWGDPRKPDEFAWLLAYSPYDNVPESHRPPLLVTGALHDPRVSVHEPAKWVAKLRATDDGSSGLLLFRVETGEGGHTGPIGRYAALGYEAEVAAYILDAVGLG